MAVHARERNTLRISGAVSGAGGSLWFSYSPHVVFLFGCFVFARCPPRTLSLQDWAVMNLRMSAFIYISPAVAHGLTLYPNVGMRQRSSTVFIARGHVEAGLRPLVLPLHFAEAATFKSFSVYTPSGLNNSAWGMYL